MDFRVTQPFWTRERIQLVSIAVIAITILGIALSYFLAPEANYLLTQGDFPSFYAAAKIMHGGMGDRLYSGTLQREIQHHYWPYITEYYIYFPYPPYFASLLSPLAALSPAAGKAVWDSLMILCAVLSLILGSKTVPLLNRNPLGTAAFLLSFFPFMMALLGSQNIALGMLLYAAILWSFSKENIWMEYLCGIFLGLWLFKPHYPLILACFFLAAGYYRVLLGFLFVAAVYYLMGADAIRWDWPAYWALAVKWFSEENARMGSGKMVSLLGFTRAFSDTAGIPAPLAEILGHLFPAVLGGLLLYQFWKAGRLSKEAGRRRMLDLSAGAGPALILLSPHTLFYDIGICVFSLAYFMELKTDRGIWKLILLQLFMTACVAVRTTVPFQPLFFAVLGSFVWIQQKIGLRSRQS